MCVRMWNACMRTCMCEYVCVCLRGGGGEGGRDVCVYMKHTMLTFIPTEQGRQRTAAWCCVSGLAVSRKALPLWAILGEGENALCGGSFL